jgi:hypothetical protein
LAASTHTYTVDAVDASPAHNRSGLSAPSAPVTTPAVDVTAPSVPLFHLVQSEIVRTRESHTVPTVKGIPETGPREARTTSVLIAHGTGAKPIIHVH